MAGFPRLKFGAKTVHRHTGKGSTEQRLPNRHAMNTLTQGDVSSRTMNDYAKATPGADDPAPDVDDFAAQSSG